MPQYHDDEDEFYGDPSQNTPLVKDLRKQLKEALKAKESAEERASKAEKSVRTRTVSDVLKDKQANPGLARYVLQDLDDPTPEAVSAWLADNGELFGYKPPAPDPSDPAAVLGLPAGTDLPPDLVAAYQQYQASQQSGGPKPDVSDPVTAKLNDPTLTKEQLLALIATQG